MSIAVGSYTFEGPYTHLASLRDQPGIYAILCQRNGQYLVVDVGQTQAVRQRIETHDRKSCWSRNCGSGVLAAAVLYTPGLSEDARRRIEEGIREQFAPCCGVF